MPPSVRVFLLLNVFAVVAAAQVPRFEDLVRRFDYDRSAALDVRETRVEDRAGVAVHDVSYASPRGGRVPAYLVTPAGKGPFAAMLFGHWMMPGSPLRNRGEFLEEAIVLARAGAVSLLIDTPLVRPGYPPEPKDPVEAHLQASHAAEQQLVDFRRGIDLLTARPDVDARRIGFVGHSFNAHVGAMLAGVEKRIGSFVLMAGSYAFEEYVMADTPEMVKARQDLGEERVRVMLRAAVWNDPVHYLAHSSPSAVFLQFGRKDALLGEEASRRAYQRFGEPRKIAFYDAGHALDAVARRDRVAWLAARLRLRAVDNAALDRIPELK